LPLITRLSLPLILLFAGAFAMPADAAFRCRHYAAYYHAAISFSLMAFASADYHMPRCFSLTLFRQKAAATRCRH